MSRVTLKGDPVETYGEMPEPGDEAPDFTLVKPDLEEISLDDYRGSRLILNVFPSVDTEICARSVRTFNERAVDHAHVLCISADLPFAMGRFCGAEGIKAVTMGSAFRSDFGRSYGLEFASGPLLGLLSRAVLIVDEDGVVVYTEQVTETTSEPDYDAAMEALKQLG